MSKSIENWKLFILLYGDKEDSGDDNSGDDDSGDNNSGDSNSGDDDSGEGSKKAKSFSQEEVNKMLANDRRKHEEKLKKTISDLENLRKSKSLSEQEKSNLTSRIEDLQSQMLTKEQLAEKEKQKLEKNYKQELEKTTQERDTWKTRHDNTLIVNAIQKAANEHKAYDIGQIVALVQARNPRVTPDLDENGEAKGTFTPRVKIVDYDEKQKKEVTLDLTISEAVKRMKDDPKNFNLFEETSQGGLGLTSGTGRSDANQPPLNDPAAYRKWRKKQNLNSGAV